MLCRFAPCRFVPRCLDDDTIRESASFRSKGRLPLLTYIYRRCNSVLVRCAQPKVGAIGRRSESDEFVIRAVRNASPNPNLMVIFDARSEAAATGNKLMGKGSEVGKNYENTKVLFMEIGNIHAVRASVDALQALCEEESGSKWLSKLEATGWLKHVSGILSASSSLARKMQRHQISCLVHCSDGCVVLPVPWSYTSLVQRAAGVGRGAVVVRALKRAHCHVACG